MKQNWCLEKGEPTKVEKNELKQKNSVDYHMIIWYFLIFSILGLILETVYGYLTMGKWESRKGLVIGPFCPIYGVGAVIFILLLTRYQDSKTKLFVLGAFLGTIIEYVLSYGLEALYGNRFWDYSYTKYHLNGRVSLTYSVFWGLLAVILIKVFKPWIDKQVQKIKGTTKKKLEIALYTFFVINAMLTVWAINGYTKRAYTAYENKNGIYVEEEKSTKMNERLFSNNRMEKIFPNLRIYDEEGNAIFIRDIL